MAAPAPPRAARAGPWPRSTSSCPGRSPRCSTWSPARSARAGRSPCWRRATPGSSASCGCWASASAPSALDGPPGAVVGGAGVRPGRHQLGRRRGRVAPTAARSTPPSTRSPGAAKVAVLDLARQPARGARPARSWRPGARPRRVTVATRLGEPGESVTTTDLPAWPPARSTRCRSCSSCDPRPAAGRHRRPPPWPGASPSTSSTHRAGLITKSEVRAVALGKLDLPATGVLWDVGAGSGSVAIECARLAPGLRVLRRRAQRRRRRARSGPTPSRARRRRRGGRRARRPTRSPGCPAPTGCSWAAAAWTWSRAALDALRRAARWSPPTCWSTGPPRRGALLGSTAQVAASPGRAHRRRVPARGPEPGLRQLGHAGDRPRGGPRPHVRRHARRRPRRHRGRAGPGRLRLGRRRHASPPPCAAATTLRSSASPPSGVDLVVSSRPPSPRSPCPTRRPPWATRAGTASVAEAAALLAAGAEVLLLPKQLGHGVTVALAERGPSG